MLSQLKNQKNNYQKVVQKVRLFQKKVPKGMLLIILISYNFEY